MSTSSSAGGEVIMDKATVTFHEYENTGRPKRWKLVLLVFGIVYQSVLLGFGIALRSYLTVVVAGVGLIAFLLIFIWVLRDFEWVCSSTVTTYELPRREEVSKGGMVQS
jgi:hypothetical protein